MAQTAHARILAALAMGVVTGLCGCVADLPNQAAAPPHAAANPLLEQVRIENQRKVNGFPKLAPGMTEVDVRNIMGPRPVSPAPGTLEYTAYIHGDVDVIYIYTLKFENGRLAAKYSRQIPPPTLPPRNGLY